MPHIIILFWLTFFTLPQILQDSMLIIYLEVHTQFPILYQLKSVNIFRPSIVPQQSPWFSEQMAYVEMIS